MGAGQRTLGGPDFTSVKFGDEHEEAVRGSVDVGGEGGNGGGERVVVHGGEIIGDGRVESCHCAIEISCPELPSNYMCIDQIEQA